MNLRLLRIFVIVYEKQSITEAAKVLFISQPAVSQAIADLENYLEKDLFIRDSGALKRNAFSHVFYEKVVAVLKQFDDLEQSVKRPQKINISASMTLVKTTLPRIIKEYEHVSHRSLNVSIVNAKEVIRRVLEHEVDLGIVEGMVSDDQLVVHVIDQLKLSFFVPIDSTMNPKNLNELVQYKILLREKGSSIRDVFDEYMKPLNIEYSSSWESANSEAISVAVENQLGIGLLPDVIIDTDRFRILELEDIALMTPVSIVYRKSRATSKTIQLLVKTIENIYH